MKKTLLLIGWVATILFPLANFMPAAAASASMSLSLIGSPAIGNIISISIRENSGSEPVNAARATITYPASLLQYVSISSSSAFSIVASNSGGGGSAAVDRGALPSVSGSQTVATVNFKVLKNSGTASLAFSSGSVISANSNTDIAAGKSGTSFALKAQPAAPPPAVKDTTPPTITAISVSGLSTTAATVNFTTSEPATSEISYGTTNAYGLAAVETTPGTTHKVLLNSPLIQPGVTYHYSVKATDPSGNAASSPDATFTIPGATLVVTVTDQSKHTLNGAKVEFDNKTATTDNKGVATLQGVTLGKKTGVITYHGDKYPFSADVTSADKPTAAAVQITIKPNYTVPVIIFVILLLVIDYFVGWRTGRGSYAAAGISKASSWIGPQSGPTGGNAVTPGAPTSLSDDKTIHPGDKPGN